MKKIVFFVTSLNSGGIENYLLRFLSFYDGKIIPIIICKGNVFGDLEEKYLNISNIQLIKMDLGYFNLSSYRKLFFFLKKNNIQSICDFTGNFAGITMLIGKIADVNNRVTFYRNAASKFKTNFFKKIYNSFSKRLVIKNSTKIFSNSKAAFVYFFPTIYQKDSRFKVIYNGIDANKFVIDESYHKKDFELSENNFVIGHVGRFDSQKNHDTILKVAEQICKKHDTIYFVLCGKETDLHLKKQVSNNPVLKNKVKLLGYREDVNKILPVFDVFFFPSITEGQPNALIEAMIVGLPVIASNIEPIKETTPIQLHHELLDPLDVDGFCKLIEEYYVDIHKRKENNYSKWASNRFKPEELFGKFYKEL